MDKLLLDNKLLQRILINSISKHILILFFTELILTKYTYGPWTYIQPKSANLYNLILSPGQGNKRNNTIVCNTDTFKATVCKKKN